MLEQMSAELAQLSALYSAKCLENSQLDEKMSVLLADKENRSSSTDLEMQNRRLQRELRQKETMIEELRQRIAVLERKVAELSGEQLPPKIGTHIRSFFFCLIKTGICFHYSPLSDERQIRFTELLRRERSKSFGIIMSSMKPV
ncbi:unnamed protein product [Toxocara canis]|uniref:ERC protein 2 n=1 Tax=Toxocara canis TaxID=6265 RepID=A0A183U6I1_TOXCA|nr:unnamed protein product [Toxocara canis]